MTRFKDHEPQLQKYGQKRASDAKKRDKKSRQQVTDQGSHGIVIAFEQDYPPISNMVSLQPQEGWDQSTKISCTSLKTCVSLILAVALAMPEDEPQTQTTEAQDNSTATSPTNTVQVEQATTTSISPSPLLGSNSDFALPNNSDLSPTAISYGMDYHPEMIAGGPKSHEARLCRRKLHKHLDRICIPETVADQERYAAPSEDISDFLPVMHTNLYHDNDSVYSAQESIAEYARQGIKPTESENDTSTSKKNSKSASELANESAQDPSMVVKQKYDPSQDVPILCPETVSFEDFWQAVADNMSYKGELAAVIAHTFPVHRMSCSKLEALIASNCTFHGQGKNLVNQWKLSTSQWFVDKHGKLYKQKIELSERYHCSHDRLWLQRDILAAFLLQHTRRSEKAQESHKKLHKSWEIQAKGKNAQAKLDLFDLEAIKRDLPELIAINQIACDYILKNGSIHLRASFKLPRSKAAQEKLQQRFRLPEQGLRSMHVQDINMTNMQSPVIRGSKELGRGYALKSASFSPLCEFEC